MGAMTRASVYLCLKLLLVITTSSAIEVTDDENPTGPYYGPSKNYINHAGGGRSQSLIQYYHDPPMKTLIDHSALHSASSNYPRPRPLFSFNSGFRPIVPATLKNLDVEQPPVSNYGADLVSYDVDQGNNKFSNPIHVRDEESTEEQAPRDTSSSVESHVYNDEPAETYTEGNTLYTRYSNIVPYQKQIQSQQRIQPRYSYGEGYEPEESDHYGHHEKKKEVHYHKHKHIHEHKHKQDHHHKHKQDHSHDHHHDNKHEHHHGHHHHQDHKHGHHHHHGHKHHQMHKHEHHEDHKHGHEHKHKNEHHHAHKHGHKHHEDHKQVHKHGHKHSHHEDHKQEHKHEHKNDHHHHHGHKHEHKNEHKHEHHNKHEHKHGHKHEHKHEHKSKHKHHKKHHHHHHRW